MENIIVIVFLLFMGLELAVETWLNRANAKFVRRESATGRIPELFRGRIQPPEYAKSVRYTLARGSFEIWCALYGTALVLIVLFAGVLPFFDTIARTWGSLLPAYLQAPGIAFCLGIGLFFSLMGIPTELYSTFVLEERFDFNKTDARTYAADKLKALLLGLVLGVPFLFGVLWLIQASGPYWWLWVFCFIFGFQLLMMIAYPTLIAPLFNKFEPLSDTALRDAIALLARRVGIEASGIFTMDGSKRSGHSNAYFTGIGKAKRIVLFDTLLNQLTNRQLLSVLGHEMGHYRLRHVQKSLAINALALGTGLFVLSYLIDYTPLFRAFGLSGPTNYGALVIFSLLAGPFTFWLGPLINYISRRHEYEADRFAVELLEDATSLEESLICLTVENLGNLTPHPWYSAYHYSHPTTVERVRAIREVAQERETAVP